MCVGAHMRVCVSMGVGVGVRVYAWVPACMHESVREYRCGCSCVCMGACVCA